MEETDSKPFQVLTECRIYKHLKLILTKLKIVKKPTQSNKDVFACRIFSSMKIAWEKKNLIKHFFILVDKVSLNSGALHVAARH